MIPVSVLRSIIGPERFDAEMKTAREEVRKCRESGEAIIPLNELLEKSFRRWRSSEKGPTIEQAGEILSRSIKFKFNLPKIRDLIK